MASDHLPKEEHAEENAFSKLPPQPDAATAPDDHVEAITPSPETIIDNQETPLHSSATKTESQTEPMEVHHHSHTERKHWKHYAFEFFMLFLAVFCGFLAEYQLEHTIEHEREKKYMASLVRDLKMDTTLMNFNIKGVSKLVKTYDTLLLLLRHIDPAQKANQLYFYFFPTHYYYPFIPSDRTMEQLRGAGVMRLIRNMDVSDSITAYYEEVELYQNTEQVFEDRFHQYHSLASQVFDYKEIAPYLDNLSELLDFKTPPSNGLGNVSDVKSPTLKLASYDPSLHIPMYNKLTILRFALMEQLGLLIELKKKATSTIKFLKKEYHIE
jgi:hypothetical protein